eukprot:g79468.t1
MYNNNIGPDGAKAFARVLEVNKTLQALGLRSNNIGDDGAKAIGKALEAAARALSLLSCLRPPPHRPCIAAATRHSRLGRCVG